MSLFAVKQVGFDGTLVVGGGPRRGGGRLVGVSGRRRPAAGGAARGRGGRYRVDPGGRRARGRLAARSGSGCPQDEAPEGAPFRSPQAPVVWGPGIAEPRPRPPPSDDGSANPFPFGLRRPRAALHGPGFGRRPQGVDAQHRVEVRVAARSDQVGETPVTQEGSLSCRRAGRARERTPVAR